MEKKSVLGVYLNALLIEMEWKRWRTQSSNCFLL